ncbi:unnamed protein product [Adineta steineri]|uniref:Uncharacterized protein n=1 Tax=Adineta steineri TaxID=433720 RepID=A0A818S439_9BILA|nr:unnamed protein product [Adineta steineri]
MQNINKKQDDERQSLINDNSNNGDQCKPSRLEWAESSWTGYLHLMCWWWMNPTLSKGYKNSLTENDLDSLPYQDKSFIGLNRLKDYNWTTTSTWRIVVQEFWKEYMIVGVFCLPYLVSRVAQPMLVRQIVLMSMDTEQSQLSTYILAILLSLCVIIQALLDQQINFRSMRVGVRIRNALASVIYIRLLSMKQTVWQHMNTGQIINLMTNDSYRFEEMCVRLHLLWEGPLEAVVIFGLLCWIMPPISILICYATLIISVIIIWLLSRYFSKYREIVALYCDKRVHAFNEFIHASYIIKMYNWEKPMEDRISQMRHEEFVCFQRAYYLRTVNLIQSFILPSILALTTFGSAWLLGYPLNVADCFATIAFFGLIRSQVIFITSVITERLKDVQVASKRIDSFIRLITMKDQESFVSTSSIDQEEKGKIIMSNASFSWHDDHPFLSSINLIIESGTFIGIVGQVGSGKSSLLSAILGEMNLINGQINTANSVFSYAPQSSWIFADTLRNNILLNRPFNEQRYRDVIYACCLDIDLSQFGHSGDLTMIGERGVNLSGGQKARLSLARALYVDADIYLIDDPLAAVDRTVAKQIYERCIGPYGLLKNKTRLLVTHQTQFLNEASQIIFLSHGHIDEQGSLDESTISEDVTDKKETSKLASMLDDNTSIPDTQPIITKETSNSENVYWTIWLRLFTETSFGIFGFFLLIIIFLLAEICYHFSNYQLSIWVKQSYKDQQRLPLFAYIYFTLLIGTILADTLRTIYYFFVILHGTNSLHRNMLKGLLRTSIQFFESNPSGRILSRVSRDQKVIDEQLPTTLLYAIKSFLMAIGSTLVICIIKPYVLLVAIVLIPIFLLLCHYYARSRRQLKQLESITRSPIFDHVSSSLNGLTTIRALKSKDHLIKLFTDKIDRYTCLYINMQGASRWFAMRLNFIPFLNTFVTIILFVIFRDEIDSSLIALGLTYAISIPKWFQLAIQQWSEADLLMLSAQRIYEYGQLPDEEDQGGSKRLVNTSPIWPNHGTIEFRNYSLRHRSSLEPVLKNINVRIESGQKIGIIGRTGAGKSSLFKGIFRFIHRSNINGEILIDDTDISRVTLNHLRSHLSSIPQQPILFSGTLRYNLDPFNHYSDDQCWMALEDVQFKEFVKKHSDGLLMSITESGNNLSVGQCQLICIARAILKKSKILLIDEATANIDEKTDELIQEIISNKFQDRTVITIAHRLNTVAKSDRILVLDNGVVVNYDTPTNILQYYQ